ncbi:hypothetical protein DIPPA_14312, partial [Diplonema papillatum]
GTQRHANALGFRVWGDNGGLAKMNQLKDIEGRRTLMFFVLKWCLDKKPEVAGLFSPENAAMAKEAMPLNMADVMTCITELSRNVKVLRATLDEPRILRGKFHNDLEPFHKNAVMRLKKLAELRQETERKLFSMLLMYGEDETSLSPGEMFQQLHNFLTQGSRLVKEIQSARDFEKGMTSESLGTTFKKGMTTESLNSTVKRAPLRDETCGSPMLSDWSPRTPVDSSSSPRNLGYQGSNQMTTLKPTASGTSLAPTRSGNSGTFDSDRDTPRGGGSSVDRESGSHKVPVKEVKVAKEPTAGDAGSGKEGVSPVQAPPGGGGGSGVPQAAKLRKSITGPLGGGAKGIKPLSSTFGTSSAATPRGSVTTPLSAVRKQSATPASPVATRLRTSVSGAPAKSPRK